MNLSRRSLLGGALAARAFRDDTVRALAMLRAHDGGPDDEAFWREVRGCFALADDSVSFNHAGLAPSPRAVRDARAREQRRTDADPSRTLWREQEKELAAVRARLAGLVGCRSDQIALVPNATYGLHTVLLGLRMAAGDEIVASAHEYSRAFHALRQRRERDGVTTTTVPLATPPQPPETVAADVLAACTPRTQLAVLSQMTYLTGQLLPVAAVARALAARGVPTLVDAAHGLGLLPDTFEQLGAAFYVACLHKWVMGPVGAGVMAVDPAWSDRVWPLFPGAETCSGAAKFEQYGTRDAAPLLALHEALDFHDWLTRERKAARLELLRRRFVAALADVPGVRLRSGVEPARVAVLTAVELDRVPADALASWLWRAHRIHVTTAAADDFAAIRVSPNVFTTPAEVDRLASLLVAAARDGV